MEEATLAQKQNTAVRRSLLVAALTALQQRAALHRWAGLCGVGGASEMDAVSQAALAAMLVKIGNAGAGAEIFTRLLAEHFMREVERP